MEEKTEDPSKSNDDPPPKGKLIVEATRTPGAPKIPHQLNLLNEATEAIIERIAIEGEFGQGKGNDALDYPKSWSHSC